MPSQWVGTRIELFMIQLASVDLVPAARHGRTKAAVVTRRRPVGRGLAAGPRQHAAGAGPTALNLAKTSNVCPRRPADRPKGSRPLRPDENERQ